MTLVSAVTMSLLRRDVFVIFDIASSFCPTALVTEVGGKIGCLPVILMADLINTDRE